MKAKILIIGGGVMGTSLALRAAQKTDPLREPVVLLERETIGAGSSGGSGAILRHLYADRIVALMARDSIREYAQFESRYGRPIGYVRTGVLALAGPDQEDWNPRLREMVAALHDWGLEIELLESDALESVFPGLVVRPGTVGAWEPDGGFVDPIQTLESFASVARAYGAVTRFSQEVREILVENGRVVGARTGDTEYRADKVVIVGGPWSHGLLKGVGVELSFRIVQPESHFFTPAEVDDLGETQFRPLGPLSFDIEDSTEERATEGEARYPRWVHPVLIDLEQGAYLRCEPRARRTRVGRCDYSSDPVLERPEDKNDEVSPELHSWARAALEARLPEAAEQGDGGGQTSWYTLTPDSQPVMGPVPGVEGMFMATGFSGHGFKLAPSVADGLTQMLFDEPVTAFDPEFFSPTRFQGDESWKGRFGL